MLDEWNIDEKFIDIISWMGIWGKQIITLHFKKLILWNIIQWTYYHHVHMLSTLFPYGPPHMIRKHSSLKSSQPYADYACKIF